jgi:MFS family permease
MGKHSVEHLSVAQRYSAWFMLAGQELVNKVVRLAIPYLVPFIAQEQGFGAAATARLLTGFSLGYVTCQVPAGAISVRLGPKFVQLCNNIGLAALFLGEHHRRRQAPHTITPLSRRF